VVLLFLLLTYICLPQPLKRFTFLAARLASQQSSALHSTVDHVVQLASEAEQSHISQYLSEMRDGSFANTVTTDCVGIPATTTGQIRQAYTRKLLMARGARAFHFWTVGLTILLSPHFLSHESAA